jgi:hypothetical protein
MDGDDTGFGYDLCVTTLARSERPHHLEELRARVTELEGVLRDRGEEVARTRAALDAFRIQYRRQVGLLHEELDSNWRKPSLA